MSSLAFAAKQAHTTKTSPFAFKFTDDSLKKENAVNYIPPNKRKLISDHLGNSSINLATIADKTEIASTWKSTQKMF